MHVYALAIGSNRRHGRHGPPSRIAAAAITALSPYGRVAARSAVIATPALGPAGRAFANAAVLFETMLDPPDLLDRLKVIEGAFGRRRGQRWRARVLDLDILLWSGGCWWSSRPALVIPHAEMAVRRFVLDPLFEIAPNWRLPRGALRVRHLRARLTRAVPLHRSACGSGL